MNSKLNVALVAMMMTLGGTAFAQTGAPVAPQPSSGGTVSQPAPETKPEASKESSKEAEKAPVKSSKGKMSRKHGKAKSKKVVEPTSSISQPKVK